MANTRDGAKVAIADNFKNIYSGLYNSVEDQEELTRLCESVERKVNVHHLHDVRRVTPGIVKEAASSLRYSNKCGCSTRPLANGHV